MRTSPAGAPAELLADNGRLPRQPAGLRRTPARKLARHPR